VGFSVIVAEVSQCPFWNSPARRSLPDLAMIARKPVWNGAKIEKPRDLARGFLWLNRAVDDQAAAWASEPFFELP
jgi:hypothetical protein